MLNVTNTASGSLAVQLCTDPADYPDNLHLHEDVDLTNLHFAITVAVTGNIDPLSWGEELEQVGRY